MVPSLLTCWLTLCQDPGKSDTNLHASSFGEAREEPGLDAGIPSVTLREYQ
jgi:hypothetical protein